MTIVMGVHAHMYSSTAWRACGMTIVHQLQLAHMNWCMAMQVSDVAANLDSAGTKNCIVLRIASNTQCVAF